MPNSKISALTAATTPVAGTETLPIVQSSVTKQVSIANLTAGRAVSSSSLSTGTTDVFANVGAQLSGGNAILARFNSSNKPAGIYTGGTSGESFIGANLNWSSGNVFNYRFTGLMWYLGDPGGGGTVVSLGVASGTAGTSAGVDTLSTTVARWTTSGNYTIVNGNLIFGTSGKGIFDTNGNESLLFTATASAVNELTIANAATGNRPTISATGGDTNIGINLTPKGGGNLHLTTGNFVIGAAGSGVNFSANTPAAGMTSQLLSAYEEGTWTPSLGGNTTYTARSGYYTKIGRQVTAIFDITVNVLGTGSATTISGLPFNATIAGGMTVTYWSNIATNMVFISGVTAGTDIALLGCAAATATLTYLPTIFGNGARLTGQVTYFT